MSKRKLAAALADAGIDYMHLPALGNPKDNRQPFRTGDAASRQRFRARLNDEVAMQAVNHIANYSQPAPSQSCATGAATNTATDV
jgi:hypothetical protein